MRSVSLHRLDQIRDEFGTALELHIDLREGGLCLVSELDQTVVLGDVDQSQQHNDRNYSNPYHDKFLLFDVLSGETRY